MKRLEEETRAPAGGTRAGAGGAEGGTMNLRHALHAAGPSENQHVSRPAWNISRSIFAESISIEGIGGTGVSASHLSRKFMR